MKTSRAPSSRSDPLLLQVQPSLYPHLQTSYWAWPTGTPETAFPVTPPIVYTRWDPHGSSKPLFSFARSKNVLPDIYSVCSQLHRTPLKPHLVGEVVFDHSTKDVFPLLLLKRHYLFSRPLLHLLFSLYY